MNSTIRKVLDGAVARRFRSLAAKAPGGGAVQDAVALGLALLTLTVGFSGSAALAAENVSLAGSWRFALDRSDAGIREQWFNRNLPDRIKLPGVLQAQEYGDEISVDTPWVLSLYDRNWFLRDDYKAYTNAGKVKVPFVCQPPRHYLGAAWYQRDIEIPADWKERRAVLFLERPRWETRVWLNGALIGTNNSLCAPHEYDLGIVPPGKHRISVRVDNRMLMNYRPDAHAVSDSLNSTWNGIVGALELRSTPSVWIEDVRVFPDVQTGTVTVKGVLGKVATTAKTNLVDLNFIPKMAAGGGFPQVLEVVCTSRWTAFEAKLESGYPVTPWDEFNPQLFELTVSKRSPDNLDRTQRERKSVRFGFRDFKAAGQEFEINGRKTHLRGTHHGGDFPLTGYPPTDVEYWRKLFNTCKQWGLNHIRFHSFCPPEAAFDAADEVGMYLQPEPGMWNEVSPNTPMERMLYLETERMIKAYGNHPSFVLFSAGNEPRGRWRESLTNWVEYFRKVDPRHLYTTGTGWPLIDFPGPVRGADYLAIMRFDPGNRLRGEGGWFGRDYSRSLRGVNVPVIAHENGQWCVYPDYDVIRKFKGYMRPGNYEIFRDSLRANGLLHKNKDFVWASGRFQLECYKEEIEANLRTPGMAGFQLLDLHDYVGQGSALVGLLDPFWEEKGYVTAAEFTKFCSPVVPLVRLGRRVFTTADAINVDLDIANYGAEPLTNAHVFSALAFPDGESLTAKRLFEPKSVPIGRSFSVGKISIPPGGLGPGAYKLVVRIGREDGAAVAVNSWNIWVYPSQVSNSVPQDVLITSSWDEAEPRLAGGGKVLFLPRNTDLGWDSPPLADVPVFWNRLMNPAWGRMLGLWCDTNHPALAGFPTEPNCDWQWTQIVRGVRPVNLGRLPRGLQPIVQAIDDWNRNWKLGAVFECRVGRGNLMVCSFDITSDLDHRVVARQLRRSLLDYMASDRFRPRTQVSSAEFRTVLFDTRIMRKLGATAAGPGAGANGVNAAIDGDPNTFWLTGGTGRGMSGTRHPHQLTVRFPEPVAMNGILLMPRQNDRDHLGDVRGYTIETSDDGREWREVSRGELPSAWAPQPIKFDHTIMAKQIRFTAQSGFGSDSSAALAELAVMYAGPRLAGSDSTMLDYRRSQSTSTDVEESGGASATSTNAAPGRP